MNCKNCNFEIPEGAAFCPNCGTKQDAPTPEAPKTEEVKTQVPAEAPVTEKAPAQASEAPAAPAQQMPPQQQYPQGAQFNQAPPYPPQAQPKKQKKAKKAKAPVDPNAPKKKSKAPIIILIIVAIIAVIGVIGFALKNIIVNAVIGDISYYALTEAKTCAAFIDDEEFAKLLDIDSYGLSSEGSITVEGETYSVSVNSNYDEDKEKGTGNISFTADGSTYGPIKYDLVKKSLA